MFDDTRSESIPLREERILKFWQDHKIFEQSVQNRAHSPHFTFYDGPPFATGLPHYGHLLAGTIKDTVLRFKTMEGHYVPRRFGWDCHGLPIENEIEKVFNLSGSHSIEAFGVGNFNEECRKIVLRYTEEWKAVVNRMGRFVDFKQTYRTMDMPFMESVWWVFKQLFEKGLVYQGYKVMPFSAKLGTPLSNFEAGENYKEVDDPALTVAFELENEPGTFLLAWTTTPWTLISNLALMVGPEIEYVKVKEGNHFYILAKSRLPTYQKEEHSIVATMKGKDLEGLRYVPLFDYFKDEKENSAFRVILEDSVSLDDGTGIVHSAPAFGEVDFYACAKAGISLVCPVDNNGQFTAEVPEYKGFFVKDADKDIAKRLKAKGVLYHQATIHHRYPFCWRSDTPLIYKVVNTWFVAVEKIKDDLIAANDQIHWTPEHLKKGRFGKWLEGARDWAISRNRYWGTPIPLWQAEDGELHVIGSIEELETLAHTKIEDLHRHYIDHLTFEKKGKTFKRIPEVFDCWFESGSMPYAQNHYPFENAALFEKNFPADFIAEGLDQTRGWFYTLTVLAAALFKKPAFKNVIVNGIVLAEDGAKMSKRLRNYPDPMVVVGKYGADAVRLYMMHSPAVTADDLCFSESGVELVLRQVIIPLWNAYSFFATYAKLYNWKPSAKKSFNDVLGIDRWILSRKQKLVQDVKKGMDVYDLSLAVEPFIEFVDQLTNWYIRRSRRRFWEDKATEDRDQAFSTLYEVLKEVSMIAAPFVPFLAEAIYTQLRTEDMPQSVHLADYPQIDVNARDITLEEAMKTIQSVVSLGHSLRKEHKLKTRQPLQQALVAANLPLVREQMLAHRDLILDELNVKDLVLLEKEEQFVDLIPKPNFRILGKKVGKWMRDVQQAVGQFTQEQLKALLDGETISLTYGDDHFVLSSTDIEVERKVKEGVVASTLGGITIALETQLTQELVEEGLAREFVNKLNTMRRDAGLHVSDRIDIVLSGSKALQDAFKNHSDYISQEVLATSVSWLPFEENTPSTEWDLNGESALIQIQKR